MSRENKIQDGDDRIRELTTCGAVSYMPTTKRQEKYRVRLLSSRSLQPHGMEEVSLGRTLVPLHLTPTLATVSSSTRIKPKMVK